MGGSPTSAWCWEPTCRCSCAAIGAWAEGVGERLTPVDFPEPVYLLLQPDVAVSTAEVFQAPELTRNSPVITIAGFLQPGGRNDCEPVVRRVIRPSRTRSTGSAAMGRRA